MCDYTDFTLFDSPGFQKPYYSSRLPKLNTIRLYVLVEINEIVQHNTGVTFHMRGWFQVMTTPKYHTCTTQKQLKISALQYVIKFRKCLGIYNKIQLCNR